MAGPSSISSDRFYQRPIFGLSYTLQEKGDPPPQPTPTPAPAKASQNSGVSLVRSGARGRSKRFSNLGKKMTETMVQATQTTINILTAPIYWPWQYFND